MPLTIIRVLSFKSPNQQYSNIITSKLQQEAGQSRILPRRGKTISPKKSTKREKMKKSL
jgi:hypothetical protein